VIEKKFCKIFEKGKVESYDYLEVSSDDDRRFNQQTPICGFLGILNISGQNFVVVITEKQSVGKIEGANIYLVKNADLIPFYDDFQQLNLIRNYIEGVKKLLCQGFYFSYNSDLTSNRQRTARRRGMSG